MPDGRTGRASGLGNLEILHRGDAVILGDNGWERAPEHVWPETNSVAVVRRVLDDGSVLIDSGVSITPIHNDAGVEVDANCTIEYNEIDGVIRVVSDTPIRSGAFGQEVDINGVRKEYLWGPGGAGQGFSDFGGYPKVIERARELIETQLERREKLEKIKARPVKGVLFTGPPGTGKTHLARIIAKESQAEFYLVSGPSIVTKWLGDTEDTLRKIFEAATASESGRAIVFLMKSTASQNGEAATRTNHPDG